MSSLFASKNGKVAKNNSLIFPRRVHLREQKSMKVGDRVRVKESVIVYNYPQSKKEPFDIKGMEGDVIKVLTDWEGRPISPNLPVLVKFEKKFRSHFRQDELEIISEAASE